MSLDGAFLHILIRELSCAIDSRVEKIHQPSRDELVFLLRKLGFSKRLLISARQGTARIHFTDSRPENPESPPMFCMLLRKHIGNGKLIKISQPELERTVYLKFSSVNEMGDITYPVLAVELIGATPNIILLGDNGRIIDAVRRGTLDKSTRLLMPGAIYEPPPSQQKLSLINSPIGDIVSRLTSSEKMLDAALLDSVGGLSPLLCREIMHRVCENGLVSSQMTSSQKNTLVSELERVIDCVTSSGDPVMISDTSGKPFEFSFMEIYQYGQGYNNLIQDGFCVLLEKFYTERDNKARLNKESQDIFKLLSNLHSRAKKRMAGRMNDLKRCEEREKFRIFGELLKANLHLISPGVTKVKLENFYDSDLREITIPLDPALSPSANASAYFKEYKKSCTASQTLCGLIEDDRREITYLESVMDNLSRADNISDIREIRYELVVAGYIKTNNVRKKEECSPYREFVSPGGYRVAVGKNNRQNDKLTLHTASKKDMWFHTKSVPGSHVIVFCGGAALTDEDIVFAAGLAARNSAAKNSSNVAVDYTYVKFVKKPPGAKPGMVTYTQNKTVFITPEQ